MKYCKKCGAQLKDDAKFCIKCGQPAGGHNTSEFHPTTIRVNPAGGDERPKSKKTWIGIGVGVLAAALIFIFIANPTMRMKGYEKPVYYLIKFMESGNIKSMAKAIPVKEIVKYVKSNAGELLDDAGIDLSNFDFSDYKEALESLNEELEDYTDTLEDKFGDNFKIEYEVKKAKQIEDLDDIQDDYDKLDIDVKDAYELTVKVKMEGDEETDRTTDTIKVIKIGRKWYIDMFSFF